MKRTVITVVLSLILFLPSCSSPPSSGVNTQLPSSPSPSALNHSVMVEFAYFDTLEKLVFASQYIVVGQVEKILPCQRMQGEVMFGGLHNETPAIIHVEQSIKGGIKEGDSIKVLQYGGTAEGVVEDVQPVKYLVQGEELLLFMLDSPDNKEMGYDLLVPCLQQPKVEARVLTRVNGFHLQEGASLEANIKEIKKYSVYANVIDKVLKQKLNIAEGEFTPQALADIKDLQLSGLHLGDDFSLLKECVNLESLTIDGFYVNDLSFLSYMPHLRILKLMELDLTDISALSGLVGLEQLYLDANKITDLSPLSHLTKLKKLHLGGNQISDLSPLSGLVQIEQLGLSDNKVQDISPLAAMKSLWWLNLMNNEVKDVSVLSQLGSLKALELNNNQIADISPIGKCSKLISLGLAGNPDSDYTKLKGLKHLKNTDPSIRMALGIKV